MTVGQVRTKYKDQWVLAEVLKENDDGEPVDLKVLEHSKNRDDTYKAMKRYSDRYTYHFYTGKLPEKGYAVTL